MKTSPNLEALLPLSPTQEGMLFHCLYSSEAGLYHNQLHYRITGDLAPDAYRRAWQHAVDRHASLRTLFKWSGQKRPLQAVRASAELPWRTLDWSDASPEEQEARFEALLVEDRARGFTLERAPLLRCALIRLAEDRHRFLCSHHHLVMDGWSGTLVHRDVQRAYQALHDGLALPEDRAPTFQSYLAWRDQQDPAKAEEFWRRELAGVPAQGRIPFPREGPREEGAPAFFEVARRLAPEAAASLRGALREHRLTLGGVASALWGLVLSRTLGEEEVVHGVTVSGRPATLAGVEETVGNFIQTLPVRTRLDELRPLVPWLRECMLAQLEREEHGHPALVDIQRWAGVPADQPLFEAIVVVENHSRSSRVAEKGGALRIEGMETRERTSYPLTLLVEEGEGVELRLLAHGDRIRGEDAARLLDHYRHLLAGLPAAMGRDLASLDIMGDGERSALLAASRGAEVPRHPEPPQAAFERQARERPEAPALLYRCPEAASGADAGGFAALSYARLDALANQLAHDLRARGVDQESLVGIYLERSPELVVALLATLKAGGAFLPLDADYPPTRIACVVEDAAPRLVIAPASASGVPGLAEDSVHRIPPGWLAETGGRAEPPTSRFEPEGLAYTLFTSGSSGRPKGAMNTVAAIENRLRWMQERYRLTPEDRVLQKTPGSFDVSVWEFFWPLLAGAGLVLARPGGHRAPAYLAEVIRSQGVTTLHFVPSMLRAFLSHPEAPRCTSLRRVISSGEALSPELVERFFEVLPDVELHNLYGPTEAAIDVTAWQCLAADAGRPVPIGRPIANLRTYVLDGALRPVPGGVPGELFLAGAGLARGYVGSPARTAARFLPDPFAPGQRMYRTGDRARWRGDGQLEYLGRVDQQVKVRGVRIEAGEVRRALLSHPGIEEAVVGVRPGADGEAQLVAWLVSEQDMPNVSSLREHLLERLPEAMVPGRFVGLDVLPLTPNGKLDGGALPDPGASRPELGAPFVAPRDVTEELLAEIWQDVLGGERVGVYDDFFELGGDSIRSLAILARARKAGLDLELEQLFTHRSVAALARAARPRDTPPADAAETEPFGLVTEADRRVLPAELEDAYPLASLQAGMLYHASLEPDALLYHNVSSYRVRATFDEALFTRALDRMAARHPVMRTSFELVRFSLPLQLVWREVPSRLEITDLSGLPATEQDGALAKVFEEEKRRPFDPMEAPLWRARVHRLGVEAFQFTLSEHHAILDGWSVASLVTEVLSDYQALLDGVARDPRPLATSFRDFVALEQRTLAEGPSRDFWLERAGDLEASDVATRSPADGAAGEGGPFVVRVPVSEQLSRDLKAAAGKAGVPTKSLLLAAHLRVLAAWTGSDRVTTGLVTNGRPETEDAAGVKGLFLNTVPLTVTLRDATWAELAGSVFRAETSLLPHRRFPLAELHRARGGAPLFDTTFNYMHFRSYEEVLSRAGMAVEPAAFYEKANFTLATECGVEPGGEQLYLALDYDPRRLERRQVERISEAYLGVLEVVASAPRGRVADAPLVTAPTLRDILSPSQDATRDLSLDRCVHELVREQAARTPDRVAVTCGTEQLTYAALVAGAQRLAASLRAAGCRPEARIGVAVERSVDMVVALLGVLEAGGAYVPLDPSWPRARLATILADAAPATLVCRRADAELLEGLPGERLWMDELPESPPPEPAGCAAATPDNLAYVIYTSGSTGRPKGVEVPHRALLNFLASMRERPGLGPDDVLVAVTTVSFDIAALELYLPLVVGARVALASREQASDGQRLGTLLDESGATAMQATPSTWRLLLESGWTGRPGLVALCGGEALPRPLAAELREVVGPAGPESQRGSVWNLYGPTETTIWSSLLAVDADQVGERAGEQAVSIGYPIANTRAYVLDPFLRPVPPGCPGELFLAGAGVARGYLSRRGLTAERFLPDPLAPVPGARMYRTGDRARLDEAGRLHYLGRTDYQVKVRGHRVELGEVEAALLRDPAVSQAVAVVRTRSVGDARIVAFVVARGGAIDLPGLRRALAEELPESMVPSHIAVLDGLPRTPNGKLDRAALPEFERPAASPMVSPRGDAEEAVAEVWSAALGGAAPGVDENFFDVGGHSLLLIRVHRRLQERFGSEFELVDLFRNPTIRSQAAFLGAGSSAGSSEGSQLEAVRGRAARQRDALRDRARRARGREGRP